MADSSPIEDAPVRIAGLSTSGVDRCPVCDSDLLLIDDGYICSKDGAHYNVDLDQFERDLQAPFGVEQ